MPSGSNQVEFSDAAFGGSFHDDELEEGELRDKDVGLLAARAQGGGLGQPTVSRVLQESRADPAGVRGAVWSGPSQRDRGAVAQQSEQLPRGPWLSVAGCKRRVWILGHSFIKRAALAAASQLCGRSLGLNSMTHEVSWHGTGGMRWGGLFPALAALVSQCLGGPPDLLVLHLGENDLVSLSGLTLLKLMKQDLEIIRTTWESTMLIWTEFVPRLHWRGARTHSALEKARRKVNRTMRLFCQHWGIYSLNHYHLQVSEHHLFCEDGVHLSALGLSFYLLELRDLISKVLQVQLWCAPSFPLGGAGKR
ncbi:uncharacterized protein LOC144827564 [Lissotriton helveticus]